MDEVVVAVEDVKKRWDEIWSRTQGHLRAIEEHGKSSGVKDSHMRLKGLAEDGLAKLRKLQEELDMLAPQLPEADEAHSAQELCLKWEEQIESLRLALVNTNLQAKANSVKTAKEERELLFGGGTESTACRRNLETADGMTSAAESITESLRRTRQLMHQEVERSGSTLMTFEDSTTVLRKAEKEYTGHKSLLGRTRNLLSTMQRQDILDRVILIVGFLAFAIAVLYVVSKRIGILKLQRVVIASIKGGMAKRAHLAQQPAADVINVLQPDNIPPTIGENLAEPFMHDEL